MWGTRRDKGSRPPLPSAPLQGRCPPGPSIAHASQGRQRGGQDPGSSPVPWPWVWGRAGARPHSHRARLRTHLRTHLQPPMTASHRPPLCNPETQKALVSPFAALCLPARPGAGWTQGSGLSSGWRPRLRRAGHRALGGEGEALPPGPAHAGRADGHSRQRTLHGSCLGFPTSLGPWPAPEVPPRDQGCSAPRPG